ncbi:cell wall hydrolase [Cohnella sp. CIP 111063]|uniref:cell wall hydrolase n=1 Tax=unclassified Cohnella TaxID=2636738 RepID=UPI000B8BB596|nr:MULTISPECIES: cell wall hydrolase [unclassified Cohnella]OXS59251.1 cell wall hydrolase [Cohnella sp. CIP 111063]PRX72267.1 copper amine oxidase-like protein [Cohnella sp. SGD-V74]
MLHRSKQIRAILLLSLSALLLLGIGLPSAAAADEDNITVKVDGKTVKLAEPAQILGGRLFLPIASVTGLLNATAEWDSENEAVTIHTAYKDKIVLTNGVPVVYFNDSRYVMDAAPFFLDGRIYIPVRYVAELLHAKIKWDPEALLAEIESVEPAVVAEDYGLQEIAEAHGVSKAVLLKRNGLDKAEAVEAGTKLQVVVPSIFDNEAKPFTEEDYRLLAKLVQVEVGYESYEAHLAVANVVLNRVADSRFPNSIRDVIYSGKQFPPAHNGLLDKSKPNATVLRATKDALNGKNNVKDAVYFYNPRVTKGAFWSGLETIATIGSHRYAK